jgi:hypothetical protein
MNKLSILGMSAVLISIGMVACGDDGDDNPGAPNGGTKSEAGEGGGASAGKGNNGGSSTAGKSGSAGTGNATSSGGEPSGGVGSGGEGGGAPVAPCDIYGDRPVEDIPVDDKGNITTELLSADKVWSLKGRYFVPAGKTLKIEPCTRIEGAPKGDQADSVSGSLFVMQGAKIDAVGTADAPILFTSEDHKFSDHPWGGVVLLGNAPIGPKVADEAKPVRIYEGMTDERASYGGDKPEDSSGSLAYVRIEYGGDIIVTEPSAKEINGLSFGGVGSKTRIDHIMVKDQADDCFEWFGGTVNADHLVCQNSGDDMFDADEGFKGHLQYLFARNLVEGSSSDPNGFEWDGNQPLLTAPVATLGAPQASNATLCAFKGSSKVSYGAVLRRSLAEGTLVENAIISGFNFGVDTRDNVGTNDAPLLKWTNSLFFGQVTADGGNPSDDNTKDGSFDEDAWLKVTANKNTVGGDAPAGFDCYAAVPTPPTDEIEGGTPGSGFDDSAKFIGAGSFSGNGWDNGSWIEWKSE